MADIKLLFMDVDGTLTDGKIYMGFTGEICKAFDVKDGFGIHDVLPKHGIVPIIITARESNIVKQRCTELGIAHVYQNCKDKQQKMIDVAAQFGILKNAKGILPKTAYIGDDVPDLKCMEIAQYKGCPSDAIKSVQEKADYISRFKGGNGAVREFIEWLISKE